jgi:hypothetical protein
MDSRRNFADPDYEPTDEDLAELVHEAFSGLSEAREASLAEMRHRIARLEREARARFDARWKKPDGP